MSVLCHLQCYSPYRLCPRGRLTYSKPRNTFFWWCQDYELCFPFSLMWISCVLTMPIICPNPRIGSSLHSLSWGKCIKGFIWGWIWASFLSLLSQWPLEKWHPVLIMLTLPVPWDHHQIICNSAWWKSLWEMDVIACGFHCFFKISSNTLKLD